MSFTKSLSFLISLLLAGTLLSSEFERYEVKRIDTLTSIAKEFELQITDIIQANKELSLEPNFLSPGKIIYIPKVYQIQIS